MPDPFPYPRKRALGDFEDYMNKFIRDLAAKSGVPPTVNRDKTRLLTPFKYQEKGRDFLANNKYALLADQPGLGKTGQAVLAAQKVLKSKGVPIAIAVFCPKSAVENWKREFKKWWPAYPGKLLVMNYDVMSVHGHPTRDEYEALTWDIVICDEAHRLKNPGAKRTQNIYRTIRKRTERVWLLTGTPARNHAGELWTHLVALRPDTIRDRSGRPMSLEQFETKYCDVYFDEGRRKIRGSKNRKEFRALLDSSGFMLRRLKKEVQGDLPDLIFDQYDLNLEAEDYLKVLDTMDKKGVSAALLGLPTQTAYELLQKSAPNLSSERRLLGLAKVKAVAEFVETELETPGKIIVFYFHRDVGDALSQRLVEFYQARVDGKTKNAQAEVDRFQNDPKTRVFLGQIQSCGEALNITAANQVVFAEASWSPSDNYQAACRAHRIGMGDSLLVRFLSVPLTADTVINTVLARKTQELAELFD